MGNESIFPLNYDTRPLKSGRRRRSKGNKDLKPIGDKLNTLSPYLKPSNPKPVEESI